MKKLLILFLGMLISIPFYAQDPDADPFAPQCLTDEAMKSYFARNPKAFQEAQIREKSVKSRKDFKATTYTIPVVFHVYGTNFSGRVVNDAIIEDALEKTNKDFQGLSYDWNSVSARFNGRKDKLSITFKLAKIDPSGNATTGVKYYPARSGFGADDIYDNTIASYAWNNYKYMNVYIMLDLKNDGNLNASGVAWLPDVAMSNAGTARVVYNGKYLGTNTDENFRRVLTHEFGHWLNLYHTFNYGCSSPGDYVNDTPYTTSNTGTCNSTVEKCSGQGPANGENMMDYTDCYRMFTYQQVTRMINALGYTTRKPLWQQSNLLATGCIEGPVVAGFSANNTNVMPGESVTFTDESVANTGTLSTWNWTFTGGIPSSYSGKTPPAIKYNTKGDFDVQLVVTNSNGDSQTAKKENFISVSDDIIMRQGTLTLESGVLYDSGKHGDYAASENKTLTLYPEDNSKKLRLNFVDFVMESDDTGCEYDYLEIFNGTNTSATRIGKYCATTSPGTVTSTHSSGALTVRFISDDNDQNYGFKAYIEYSDNNTRYTMSSGSQNVSGGNFFDSATFGDYANSENKTMTFNPATSGKKLQFTFLDLEMEDDDPDCEYDYLTIYDGTSTSATKIGTYCSWTNPGVITATNSSGSLTFKFVSDDNDRNVGWWAKIAYVGGSSSDTEDPSAPSNLTSSNVTQTGASLSWTASTDNVAVTGYDIFRGSTDVGDATGTSFNVTGLSAGTTYSFTVKAKDEAGNVSAASNAVSVTTPGDGCTYCAAKGTSQQYEWITGVQVGGFSKTSAKENGGYSDFTSSIINLTAGSNVSVTLTPNTTQYTEHFKVWIDYNGDCDFADSGEEVLSGSAQGNTTGTISVPSSASGTTRMRVSMLYNAAPAGSCTDNAYGEVEDYTVSFGGSPTDTQAPSAPTNLSSSNITQTGVTLSWTASTDNVGVTSYEVFNGSASAGTTSGTSFVVNGLTASTTYSFTVKAKDAANNVSAASSALSVTTQNGTTTDTQAPTTPGAVTVTATTSSSISLSWGASTDNVGVTSYTVNNSTDNANYISTGTTYTVTGLTADKNYTFYINAKDAAGNTSGWNAGVQGKTDAGTSTGCTGTYCASASNRTQYEHIKEVKVGSFTNASDAQKYSDFTSKTINIVKGQATSITLTPGFAGSAYNEYFKMWIDLNADCDFDDTGELVYDAGSAKNTAVTGSITVPTTAFTGNTRMRVSMKYNAGPNQCDNGTAFGDGEVEDYTVNLSASKSAPIAEAGTDLNIYPNPSAGLFNIKLDNNYVGDVIVNVFNMNGQLISQLEENKDAKEVILNVNVDLPGVYNVQLILGGEALSETIVVE